MVCRSETLAFRLQNVPQLFKAIRKYLNYCYHANFEIAIIENNLG